MTLQTKIHDGVIAALNLISILLAVFVHPWFLGLAVLVALVMVSSLFTGFCPVHWSVGKLWPPKTPS
jgi:hypothetical protein